MALYFHYGAKRASTFLAPDGSLGLGSLAAQLGLEPLGVTVGPHTLNFNSSTQQSPAFAVLLTNLRAAVGDEQLGSAERPIKLEGRPAGAAGGGTSSAAAARTPEAKRLLTWLRQQELDISSKEAFLGWMSQAPVSARTQQFFVNNVCELPDLSGKCILGYTFSDETAVIREDFTSLLLGLGRQEYSIVVLTSARRTGKSMGCLNSLLQARQQLFNKADKLVVLGTAADLPVDNLKTILCISMLCGLPIVLDELSDIRACAKGIKAYIEDAAYRDCNKPPLSVLVIGSEQQAIHNAAITALGGLHHMRVAPVTLLPAPTLGVVVTMLEHRRPHLQGDGFAAAVLSALTLSGPNLMEHWTALTPRAEDLVRSDISKITFLPSELAHVLSCINSGSAIEQNANSLGMLCEFGFIRPRVVAGKLKAHMYDYIDYRLITFQELHKRAQNVDVHRAIETAEGRVLEEVLRTQEGSRLLAEVLGLQDALDANWLVIYYGQLTTGKEVDLLIVENVGGTAEQPDGCNLFMCSVKRSERQQEVKSFTEHLGKLYKLSNEMAQHLRRARRLTFVAVSCIRSKDGVAHVESRRPRSWTLPLCDPQQQWEQQQQDGTQQQQQQEEEEEGTAAVGSTRQQDQSQEGKVGRSATTATAGKDRSSSSTVSLCNRARQQEQQLETAVVAPGARGPAEEQDWQQEDDTGDGRMTALLAGDGSSSCNTLQMCEAQQLQDGIAAIQLATDDGQQQVEGKVGSTRTALAGERGKSSSSGRQDAGKATAAVAGPAAEVEQPGDTLEQKQNRSRSKTARAAAAAEAEQAVEIPVDRVARVLFEDLLTVAKRMPLATPYSISA